MSRSFDYIAARPFGWFAFVLWVVAIVGAESFGIPEYVKNGLFLIGAVLFVVGGIKGLKSERNRT